MIGVCIVTYNQEKYIAQAIESVLSQADCGHEVVIYIGEDNSTDKTGAICDEIAKRVNELGNERMRVKVIHNEQNLGLVGNTMNLLDIMRNDGCDYIAMLDGDDYWCDDHKLQKQMAYLNTRMGYACYAVMFILRRDLIYTVHHTPYTENNVLFSKGLHFEDVDWLPRMMLRAKRVNSTQTIVYNYFIRQGSITQVQGSKEKIRKNLEDRMKIIETYSAYLKQHPSCYWLKNMQSNMAAGVLTTVAQSFYQERKEYISRLKAFNVFPLSIADQGKSYIRKARIINLSPRLAVELLHLKNSYFRQGVVAACCRNNYQ